MPAQVDLPTVPYYLYRYRGLGEIGSKLSGTFTRELSALAEPYVWCSNFEKMNDPMEGFFRPSTRFRNTPEFKEKFKTIYAAKQKIGIVSFSDDKSNDLMWAHYAGNYSGICIRYRAEELLASLPDGVRLARLGYSDRLPRLTQENEESIRTILSQKKSCWAYEREWRILGPVGQLKIGSNAISRIYLGSRIEKDKKEELIKLARQKDIKMSEMSVSDYKHGWKDVHPPRAGSRARQDVT
ncbi:MAG: DUF2971 domain-containing protein [Methylobacterium sp.]|uniref:DUF2971 domain-containing protein n=1 Tax=Methylobacterium sp. TaxID=409 RepID=UPI0025880289|nr:DUF2971 domain-containing protein [Methylobacterium sp.]MBY0296333.1 DUF2971 domain-containing protein [Methylobacterium sp.]